jgi:CheY-like chemotaxis protein
VKDEFLATLSHELRTPLSAILGWVHVLRRKLSPDPSLQKGVDVIERSARVQTQLIEDLLDMSRITSGKLVLDPRPLAPADLVEAAVDSIRPGAAAAGVAIEVVLEDAVPLVVADQARLQQVVWNLLTNAVKFSPRGGTVTVRLGAEDGCARIAVRDTGIGIKPEFLPHVFDRFRQADGSTTRRFGGLGLGLAIVRNLVELHGGTITAESEGEGRGACFTVRLPPQAPAGGAQGDMAPGAAAGSIDLSGMKVLVVDDEPDVLELLTRVLNDANALVLSAPNAEAALRMLQQERPHLLVSDIGMPDTDGYELVDRLRRLGPEQGGAVPAIALTAFARPEDRQRALGAGFALHLTKPIEPAALLASIARLARLPEADGF